MAVNSIIFGGVNSADYGIYISGEGVFNAPKRDVEMIAIPGRNGEFALDKGRFENIEVTYPAFNFEPDDYETFAKNLSDFRNAICSLRGYQRLTDTFHPEEYRMATYIGGLDIKPIKYNTASQFNIVFDCKPQRYLMSGEDAVTIGEWGETETASGEIATFEGDEATGIKSLVVDIEPAQSGSGTPSPDNVRPISGYDSAVTSVSPTTSASDATTYTTNLNGTRYGGTLDVVSGVLTVTKAIVDLGALNWNAHSQNGRFFAQLPSSANAKPARSTADVANIICSQYVASSQNNITNSSGRISFDNSANPYVNIYDTNYSSTSASDFKTAMNGVQLCYELATPQTVQLTAQQVSALVGTNNIWANSGDVTVEYGQDPNALVNPTLFESGPLLEVEGYGTIGFNGYEIKLDNATIGNVTLANQKIFTGSGTTVPLLPSYMNAGDSIYVSRSNYVWRLRATGSSVSGMGISSASDSQSGVTTNYNTIIPYTSIPQIQFQYGTVGTYTNVTTINGSYYQYSWEYYTAYITTTVRYNGADTITVTRTTSGFPPQVAVSFDVSASTVGEVIGDSTTPALGHPTYIDCDLGETYLIEDGNVISLDRLIDLGSNLPKLAPGKNVVSIDSTVTELKIRPRWWKV